MIGVFASSAKPRSPYGAAIIAAMWIPSTESLATTAPIDTPWIRSTIRHALASPVPHCRSNSKACSSALTPEFSFMAGTIVERASSWHRAKNSSRASAADTAYIVSRSVSNRSIPGAAALFKPDSASIVMASFEVKLTTLRVRLDRHHQTRRRQNRSCEARAQSRLRVRCPCGVKARCHHETVTLDSACLSVKGPVDAAESAEDFLPIGVHAERDHVRRGLSGPQGRNAGSAPSTRTSNSSTSAMCLSMSITAAPMLSAD